MEIKVLFFALTVAGISITATAQELFVKNGVFSPFESTVKYGQIISERNTIGEYPILPTGFEVKAVYSKASTASNVAIPMGRLTMMADQNKVIRLMLDMSVNLDSMSAGDWTDEPCKREDYLWKRSTGRPFADVNCVSINHRVNFFANPTGDFQQLLVRFKDDAIEIPPTTLTVTFTRYSTQGRRLVYALEVNPELYGFQRDTSTSWGASVWHKNFIDRDPKKVEFVENIKKWSTDVQDRMNAAFKKDLNAFVGLKPIDAYLTVNKNDAKP